MTLPSIAIVVPAYKRDQPLVTTIESLLAAEYSGKREIVVVDQTPKHTKEVEDYLAKKAREGAIRLFKAEDLPFQSLTKARNFGLAETPQAEIVIFTDDDVEVPAQFIKAHVAAYTDETVGAVAGRITVPGHTYPKENPEIIAGVTWFGAFINNFYGTKEQDAEGFVGCNFSLRRTVLEKVRGFDEAFTGNAIREDTDMAVRIRKAGYRIIFRPSAHLIHHMELEGGTRSASSKIAWYQSLFTNTFLFYGKHASRWRLPFFLLHLWRPILVCWLYYGKGSPRALRAVIQGVRDGYAAARQSNYLS